MSNLPHHDAARHAINTSIAVQWMFVAAFVCGSIFAGLNEADQHYKRQALINQENIRHD